MTKKDEIRNHYIIRIENASGVLVKFDNDDIAYIFTAYHVVKGKSVEELSFSSQEKGFLESHPIVLSNHPLYFDEERDAAVLVVRNNFQDLENTQLRSLMSYKGGFYHIGFPECRTASSIFENIVHNISHVDGGTDSLVEYENEKGTKDSEIVGTSGGGIFTEHLHELVGIHVERANSQKREFLGKALFIPIICFINLINRYKLPNIEVKIDCPVDLIKSDYSKKQLTTYLRNVANQYAIKHSKVRTFLYRNEDQDFEKVYYPLSLNRGKYPAKAENIRSVGFKNTIRFFHDKGKRVVIIGNAGSGKTMLMKHLYLLASEDPEIIPIMVELRRMRNRSLKEYITSLYFENDTEVFDLAFNTGCLIIFFDGFDELTKERRDALIEEFDSLIVYYPNNRLVLSSRPETGAEGIAGFEVFSVNPLYPNDIYHFISRQFSVMQDGQEYIDELWGLLQDTKHSHYREYIENPLLLSMVILTYLVKRTLPEEKHIFYRDVFDTFAYLHDSNSKTGKFSRKELLSSGLSREKIQNVLEAFSYLTYSVPLYSFSRTELIDNLIQALHSLSLNTDVEAVLDDLQVAYSMIIEDNGVYTFPHRSLQEFFFVSFVQNSGEDKKELYEQLLDMDNPDKNLWSLLKEMDEIDFSRYYVLPMLSTFVSQMEENGDIVYNYSKYFKILISLDGRLVRLVNQMYSFLQFLSLAFIGRGKLQNCTPIKKRETLYKSILFIAKRYPNILKDKGFNEYVEYVTNNPRKVCLAANSQLNKIPDYYSSLRIRLSDVIEHYREESSFYEYEESILEWHQYIKHQMGKIKEENELKKEKKNSLIKRFKKH